MAAGDLSLLALIALVSLVISYIGAAVGLVLGQLRLILLVVWLGPLTGAATSLAISSVGALFGALRHAREGRVRGRLLLTFGVPSALAAFASASFAPRIDPRWLELAIASTLLVSGAVMELRRRADRRDTGATGAADADADADANQTTGDAPADDDAPEGPPPLRQVVLEVAVGGTLGALSGVVGLLLGSLRLPVLLRLVRAPKIAVGSNMAIGAITGSLAGLAAVREGTVDPLAFAVLAPVTMLATHFGARTTGSLRRETLIAWIAWVLIFSGLMMVAEIVAL
ncbi:MAG: sulfite exporter TauE/SafE family protein [Myxococcales bacterium]|nr:sulfite exporter TauE/SafE family protein [Myxococcales bacterium]